MLTTKYKIPLFIIVVKYFRLILIFYSQFPLRAIHSGVSCSAVPLRAICVPSFHLRASRKSSFSVPVPVRAIHESPVRIPMYSHAPISVWVILVPPFHFRAIRESPLHVPPFPFPFPYGRFTNPPSPNPPQSIPPFTFPPPQPPVGAIHESSISEFPILYHI